MSLFNTSLFGTILGERCPNCGSRNVSTAYYCQNCGTKLASPESKPTSKGSADQLPSTNTGWLSHDRIIGDQVNQYSGKFASGNSSSSTRQHDNQTRSSYTPPHLREEVLRNRASLEGERKQVTVLFVDIKDSQTLASQLDAESWHNLLDDFFEILNRCVHQFEGTVNQYTGDGIMALFGAPIAHEDHAQRAAYAALKIHRDIQPLQDQLEQLYQLPLGIRLGLNSGEVIVGKIGDDLRMDYTAQGATVGLAARMESFANAGQICLSSTTAELISPNFRLKDLGSFSIKGESNRQSIYELKGVRTIRTRFESNHYQLTPFIGREETLNQLHQQFSLVIEGIEPIQSVSIVADAGLGKSRLAYEFAQQCNKRYNALYLEAHGATHGQHVPFLPIIELTRQYFNIQDNSSLKQAQKSIDTQLKKLRLFTPQASDLIAKFVGLAPTNLDLNHSQQLSQDGDINFSGLYKLFKHIATAGYDIEPTVIVLDDLHLFDPASLKLITELTQTFEKGSARILLISNYRPLFTPEWAKHAWHKTVILEALDQTATETLLSKTLGSDTSITSTKQLIQERAAGNPLFIEAISNELVEAGYLTGKPGHYVQLKQLDNLKVPATVQALLNARIDRLNDTEKLLLQITSVIGKHAPDKILYKASGVSLRDFNKAVGSLISQQLLLRQKLYPQAVYSFPHPLLQESVYQSLLREQRQKLHGFVADATINYYKKNNEQAGNIAYHFDQAKQYSESIQWHRRAASWTRTRDISKAMQHWQSVYDLREYAPADQQGLFALEACARQLQLGSRRGMPPETAKKLYVTGLQLSKELQDRQFPVLLEMAMGSITAFTGSLNASQQHYRHAAQIAADDQQRIVAWIGLIQAMHTLGKNRQALAILDQALALTHNDPEVGAHLLGRSPLVSLLLLQAWIAVEQGKTEYCSKLLQRAKTLAKERGESEHIAWYRCIKAVLWLNHPDASNQQACEKATIHLVKATRIARQSGNRLIYILASTAECQTLLQQQQYADCLLAGQNLLAYIDDHHIGTAFKPRIYALLAHAELASQHLDQATEYAKLSLRRAEKSGTKGYAIEALLVSCAVRLAVIATMEASHINTSNTDEKTISNRQKKAFLQVKNWLTTCESLIRETGLTTHQSTMDALIHSLSEQDLPAQN